MKLVQWVCLGNQVIKAFKAPLVAPALMALPDPQGPRVLQDPPEQQARRVHRVFKVIRDLLG